MPGVTILSETISPVNMVVFFIDLCVGIAMLIFGIVCAIKFRKECPIFPAFILAGIVFLGVGFYRLAKAKDSQNQKMQYKVIVDDTVKAKDFLEKYTIIEVDGKIYTVEDRGTPYGHVDIFMNSHSACLVFGLRYAPVYQL